MYKYNPKNMFLSISTKIFFTKVYKTSNLLIFTTQHRKDSGPVYWYYVKERECF